LNKFALKFLRLSEINEIQFSAKFVAKRQNL